MSRRQIPRWRLLGWRQDGPLPIEHVAHARGVFRRIALVNQPLHRPGDVRCRKPGVARLLKQILNLWRRLAAIHRRHALGLVHQDLVHLQLADREIAHALPVQSIPMARNRLGTGTQAAQDHERTDRPRVINKRLDGLPERLVVLGHDANVDPLDELLRHVLQRLGGRSRDGLLAQRQCGLLVPGSLHVQVQLAPLQRGQRPAERSGELQPLQVGIGQCRHPLRHQRLVGIGALANSHVAHAAKLIQGNQRHADERDRSNGHVRERRRRS